MRGFDEVLKALSGMWNERAWRLQYLGGSIRADHRQHPRVYRLFAEAAASLDIATLPELYIELSPTLNASCVGMSKPFIVVSSRAVEALDDDELRYILGHELGHLLSGHAVYRTMMAILARLSANIAWLPAGSIVLRGIIVALHEWWRKAELSADRAGLLAGQDPSAALRAHMKLAGGGDLSEVDTTAFLEQAAEYESAGDLRESLIKLRLTVFMTHPLPVARAADLRHWIDSGHYAACSPATTRAATPTATPRSAVTRRPQPTPTAKSSSAPRIRWSACCASSATVRPGSAMRSERAPAEFGAGWVTAVPRTEAAARTAAGAAAPAAPAALSEVGRPCHPTNRSPSVISGRHYPWFERPSRMSVRGARYCVYVAGSLL